MDRATSSPIRSTSLAQPSEVTTTAAVASAPSELAVVSAPAYEDRKIVLAGLEEDGDDLSGLALRANESSSDFATDKIPFGVNRWVLLVMVTIYAILIGVHFFNWTAWEDCLMAHGAFSSLCPDGTPFGECDAQKQKISAIFPLMSLSFFSFSFVAGLLLDIINPKTCSLVGNTLLVIGWLFLACASEAHQVLYTAGFVFIGCGADPAFFGILSVANLFPGHGSTVIAIFAAARAATMVLPVIVSQLQTANPETFSFSYQTMAGALMLCGCWAFALLFIPRKTYKAAARHLKNSELSQGKDVPNGEGRVFATAENEPRGLSEAVKAEEVTTDEREGISTTDDSRIADSETESSRPADLSLGQATEMQSVSRDANQNIDEITSRPAPQIDAGGSSHLSLQITTKTAELSGVESVEKTPAVAPLGIITDVSSAESSVEGAVTELPLKPAKKIDFDSDGVAVEKDPRAVDQQLLYLLRTVKSPFYGLLICVVIMTVIRNSFFLSSASSQLGSTTWLLTWANAVALIPCPVLGYLADRFGAIVVIQGMNIGSSLAFLCLVCAQNAVPNGPWFIGFGYATTALIWLGLSFNLSQFYCYVAEVFPTEHLGKLAGFASVVGGLFGMLVTPMTNFSLDSGEFLTMDATVLAFSVVNTLVIALLAWKVRRATLPLTSL